jgi:nucleoid DNA-binding protein
MKATDREKKILFMLVQEMTKKELIDAIASGSKLTKADAGRLMASLPKKEIIEFLFGMEKTALIDAIASSAKLTKADAGRALDATIEQIKKLKVVFGGKGQ